MACDSWNRWREDLDSSDWLKGKTYRLLLEWSRLEPEESHFDAIALNHYRESLEEIHKRGIESLLTL